MHSPKVLKRHADLVDRMAQTVGVDLEAAVLEGRLRFDQIADAVLQCTRCSDPDHCGCWLEAEPARDAPPGYCRNADLLKALAPEAGS